MFLLLLLVWLLLLLLSLCHKFTVIFVVFVYVCIYYILLLYNCFCRRFNILIILLLSFCRQNETCSIILFVFFFFRICTICLWYYLFDYKSFIVTLFIHYKKKVLFSYYFCNFLKIKGIFVWFVVLVKGKKHFAF